MERTAVTLGSAVFIWKGANLEIINKNISELIPYDNNPRFNEKAVEAVANSIKEFGFKVPVVIDKKNVIVAGHTRLKACKKLGIKEIPCIIADDLSETQIKAFRLADNKVAEAASWNLEQLGLELSEIIDIDMEAFGFSEMDILDFSDLSDRTGEADEGYEEFEEKFKPKKTTDDCFTPVSVYETIKDWVCEEYNIKDETPIIRPFYPGGDYENYEYPKECVVIDNPPFSILAEIKRFYISHGIKFFLFAPHLTLFSSQEEASYIITDAKIIYENGANVDTSFVTNLEKFKMRTAPELRRRLCEAQKNNKEALPKHEYPNNVTTAALLGKIADVEFKVAAQECEFIRRLDSQKESGAALYGSGYLLSDKAAEAKAEAEKTAEKIADEKRLNKKNVVGGGYSMGTIRPRKRNNKETE